MKKSQSQTQIAIQNAFDLTKLNEIRSQPKGISSQISSQREGRVLPSLDRFIVEGFSQDNENIIIALPHVPEDILKQDMERDQDSMNQDENNA